MARSRNIKPALFKNEILGEADPMLTILFIGLWCLADRCGRLEDRPKRIKVEIFPYRENININGYLTELERLGFIHRYTCENQDIIQVLTFNIHQNPHKTEKDSALPEYSIDTCSCVLTVKDTLSNGSCPADSLLLIPDSLNTDSLNTATPEKTKQEKKPQKKISTNDILELFIGVSEKVRDDFIAHRKNKKALITETAIDGIKREAAKANVSLETALKECCERGWAGFKAEWYLKSSNQTRTSGRDLEEEARRHEALEIELFGKKSEEKDITNESSTL